MKLIRLERIEGKGEIQRLIFISFIQKLEVEQIAKAEGASIFFSQYLLGFSLQRIITHLLSAR